ncbi:MAG: hypothetical protein AAF720_04095 [Pseudomonadota bacterium]
MMHAASVTPIDHNHDAAVKRPSVHLIGAHTSLAEWRFEIRAGSRFAREQNYSHALHHYERAVLAADRFAQLAHDNCFNSVCAVRALFHARMGKATALSQLQRIDEAVVVAERLFFQLCAGAASPVGCTSYRLACCARIPSAQKILIGYLMNSETPKERLSEIHAIADRVLANARVTSKAA